MKPTVIIVIVVIALVLIGGAWYAYSNPSIAAMLGLRHSPMQNTSNDSTPNSYSNFGGAQGGFAKGSIEILNGNSFTITLADGTTKNINITGTTTPHNNTTAPATPTTITPDQLSVGEQVFVVGSPNPDGSITADRVMTGALPARPTGGRGFGPHTTSGVQNGANGGRVLPTPVPN